jgi:hypothetical protein
MAAQPILDGLGDPGADQLRQQLAEHDEQQPH